MGEFFLQFSLEDARRSVFSPYFGRLIITREDMRRVLDLEYYDRRLFEVWHAVYGIAEFKDFQMKINLVKRREEAKRLYEEFLQRLKTEDRRLMLEASEAQDRLEQEVVNTVKPWDLWLIGPELSLRVSWQNRLFICRCMKEEVTEEKSTWSPEKWRVTYRVGRKEYRKDSDKYGFLTIWYKWIEAPIEIVEFQVFGLSAPKSQTALSKEAVFKNELSNLGYTIIYNGNVHYGNCNYHVEVVGRCGEQTESRNYWGP
ncbi:MAG: hypothetical protein QXU47_02965 [Candidatus Bathyarchaeia archaeon]